MLGQHGEAILNSIHARQPDLANQWAVAVLGEILAEEGRWLAKYLQPDKNQTTSELLVQSCIVFTLLESVSKVSIVLDEVTRRTR